MNRIILVGNGFDLAHKLPTKYEDFINWYWAQWNQRLKFGKTRIEEDEFYSFKLNEDVNLAAWYMLWEYRLGFSPRFAPEDTNYVNIAREHKSLCTIKEKSLLFNNICRFYTKKNWVDIESEYYNHIFLPLKGGTIKDLNDQFEIVKTKLIDYLSTIQSNISQKSLIPEIKRIFIEPLRESDIAVSSSHFWKDFSTQIIFSNNDRFLPDRTLLLNFNYTTMADMYLPDSSRYIINHIHGQLSDPDSIIFGYGDEIDKHYSELTDFNDNEYLRHIKSFKYLESSNYKNLLSFIESEPYQICIMGHSCGISDRTLLKTLFEHPNCVSIKPYYYKQPSGQDNYLDIVQNISRNFSDMRLMRDRVVNKTLCTYLPQKEAEQQHIDE